MVVKGNCVKENHKGKKRYMKSGSALYSPGTVSPS